MTSPEQVLSDFIDAWNAGRRPRVPEFLSRVAPDERAQLAERLGAWLAMAPVPRYDAEARAAIRAEPAVRRVLEGAGAQAGLLPAEVARLRRRRSLSVRDVASRVAATLGLADADTDRTATYLERLERGDLDPARLSRRLIGALADAVEVTTTALADAAAVRPLRPAAAGTLFRAEGADPARAAAEDLDALAAAAGAPAPASLDEVDRLFLGGPDA